MLVSTRLCWARSPPNTLFRLKQIKAPGEWEAPGGIFPKQRLLVVTATYLPPVGGGITDKGGGGDSKLCAKPFTLAYGNRTAYVEGIDALIAKPLLTMEQVCIAC